MTISEASTSWYHIVEIEFAAKPPQLQLSVVGRLEQLNVYDVAGAAEELPVSENCHNGPDVPGVRAIPARNGAAA